MNPIKIASKAMSAGLIAASLIGPPIAVFLPVQPAHAEFRAQQKRTYFRFVPKILKGRDFYKNELKQAIEKEDWAIVSKFFEEYVTRVNPNDPGQVEKTDTFVNENLFRPLVSKQTIAPTDIMLIRCSSSRWLFFFMVLNLYSGSFIIQPDPLLIHIINPSLCHCSLLIANPFPLLLSFPILSSYYGRRCSRAVLRSAPRLPNSGRCWSRRPPSRPL
jgi:hypothetical protein